MSNNKLSVFMEELKQFESAGTVYLDAFISNNGGVSFKVATSINDEEQVVWADYTGQVLKVKSSSVSTRLRIYAPDDQATSDALSVTITAGALTGPTVMSTPSMSVYDLGPHFISLGGTSYDLTIAFPGAANGGTTITIQLSNSADAEDVEPTIIVDDELPDPGTNPVGRDFTVLPAPRDVLELFAMVMTLQQVARGVIDKTLGRRQSRDAASLRLLTDVNLSTAKTFETEMLRFSSKVARGEGEQNGHGPEIRGRHTGGPDRAGR